MPTYVFKCEKCGNVLEQLLSLKEYVEQHFPLCMEEGCDGHPVMKPQIQAVPSIFKGTGWTPKYSGGLADGPPTDIVMPKKR